MEDFGIWLRETRKQKGLVSTDFDGVDSSTIIRIENGKTKVRFQTALEILRKLKIELPEFLTRYVGIAVPEVAYLVEGQISTSLSDGGEQLHTKDIVRLTEMYWDDRTRSTVLRLIGRSIIHIINYEDNDRMKADQLYPPMDYDSERLVGHLMLRDSKLFNLDWLYLGELGISDIVFNAFSAGATITPEDAYVALVSVVDTHNENCADSEKIKRPSKFNRERFRLTDILTPCTQLSHENCAKLFSLFWHSYQFESTLLEAFKGGHPNQLKQANEIGTLLFTLWRWLQYYDDKETLNVFADAMQSADQT